MGWNWISLITTGPTAGAGLLLPSDRWDIATKSAPTLVRCRPNETPLAAAPKDALARQPESVPTPSAWERSTWPPRLELNRNAVFTPGSPLVAKSASANTTKPPPGTVVPSGTRNLRGARVLSLRNQLPMSSGVVSRFRISTASTRGRSVWVSSSLITTWASAR